MVRWDEACHYKTHEKHGLNVIKSFSAEIIRIEYTFKSEIGDDNQCQNKSPLAPHAKIVDGSGGAHV